MTQLPQALYKLVLFHESGGHLGDGSDDNLQRARSELTSMMTKDIESDNLTMGQWAVARGIAKTDAALSTLSKERELLKEARDGIEQAWRSIEYGWRPVSPTTCPDVIGLRELTDRIDNLLNEGSGR